MADEPTYRILEHVPEYDAVVILWPKELPIPAFIGEVGSRKMVKSLASGPRSGVGYKTVANIPGYVRPSEAQ